MIDYEVIEKLNGHNTFDTFEVGGKVTTHTILPGKWVKWIKGKTICQGHIHVLEIREIENEQYVCLISRVFKTLSPSHKVIQDKIIQQELYTSNEDFKKFEMYNEK